MDVCLFCVCCVLSGRGLCDKLMTRPRGVLSVVVCDQEASCGEEAMVYAGLQSHR
jgi:hypothetical protein